MRRKMHTCFGKRLNQVLDDSATSQTDAAKKSGLTKASISAYILGKSLPNIAQLIKICNALEITPNYLLGFESKHHADLTRRNACLESMVKRICDELNKGTQQ